MILASRTPLALALALGACLTPTAFAQESGTTAPSVFQREVDDLDDPLAGPEYEVDAGEAQAEAIEDTGSAAGLSPSAERKIEEIVVRARRRAELLENTPVTVTALSPELLREANVTNLNEIQNLVPNISLGSNGLGAQIRIRGVGNSSNGVAFDPGVGLYLDGVFMPRSRAAVLDLVDVQQIEVLRGPQGTLFGKNTVGGAVNVTTVKPQMHTEGFVFLRPGSLGTVNTRGMLNLAVGSGWLEGKLATRLSFGSRNARGYVYNTFRDKYVSGNASQSFVGSVRFLPIDDLTIDVSGSYAKQVTPGPGGQCQFMEEQQLTDLAPGLREACAETTPFVAGADLLQLSNVANYGVWGIVQYDVGDVSVLEDVSLRSVTSWRQRHSRSRLDLDATRITIVALNSSGGGPGLDDGTPGRAEQIQQEVQLNATAWEGRINFITGLFTYWENAEQGSTVFSTLHLPGGVTTVNGSNSNIKTDNFTWALFGQGTVDFTDWLSATAGIRYTSDGKSIDQLNQSVVDPDAPTGASAASATFDSWTPMANLTLRAPDDLLGDGPLDHVLTYFTYARGFKGGGINAATQVNVGVRALPFQPETLDNFELGFKTISFDRRLTANIALFHGKYDDIQVTQQRTFVDENGNPSVQRATLNAAKATIQGVELEIQARPVRGMFVTGSLGYLDTRFGSFPNALSDLDGSVIDRSGQSFNSAPRWQSYLAVQYSLPVSPAGSSAPWLDGWVTPRIDWAYRDRYHVLGPEVPQSIQTGYHLVGLRLSYGFMDDRAQVALWATNLLNDKYFNTAFSLGGTYGTMVRWYQPPRMFGGELSYRFG